MVKVIPRMTIMLFIVLSPWKIVVFGCSESQLIITQSREESELTG